MTDPAIAAVLRRDRTIVLSAIVVTVALAWAYVVWLAFHMDMTSGIGVGAASGMRVGSGMTMDMSPAMPIGRGMSIKGMDDMMAPALRSWNAADFGFMFAMWAVMMVGMMLPSVTPMVLLYGNAGRRAAEQDTPFPATSWFVAGYLLVWVGFSFAATLAQWELSRLTLLTPMMATASDLFGAAVLIGAGIYQWSPLKYACLTHCQSPIGFLISRGGFRASPWGSLRLGFDHGAVCVGCCWVLMLLLFVGGIMNLLWIAGLTVFVLVEKVVPTGRLAPRVAGVAMVAAGLFFLCRAGLV